MLADNTWFNVSSIIIHRATLRILGDCFSLIDCSCELLSTLCYIRLIRFTNPLWYARRFWTVKSGPFVIRRPTHRFDSGRHVRPPLGSDSPIPSPNTMSPTTNWSSAKWMEKMANVNCLHRICIGQKSKGVPDSPVSCDSWHNDSRRHSIRRSLYRSVGHPVVCSSRVERKNGIHWRSASEKYALNSPYPRPFVFVPFFFVARTIPIRIMWWFTFSWAASSLLCIPRCIVIRLVPFGQIILAVPIMGWRWTIRLIILL